MGVTEAVRKRKIPIAVAAIVIVVSLVSLLMIVPLVFGEQFVSFSPKLVYIVGPGNPTMEVVYIDGSLTSVVWIGLHVNVTNSYVVPVEVRYNGFEFVWLIYNQTVTDPTDVVGNKDYLVWGAFRITYSSNPYDYDTYGFQHQARALGNMTGYEYYATHKDQSNYTKTIPVGTHRYYYVFLSSITEPITAWCGRNYKSRQPVSPGTYHIYVIAYGKVSEPINLTVTSVL
jgi:hypothetical protein